MKMGKKFWMGGIAMVCGALFAGSALGQGAALRAVSPISESVAGAVTAAPIDAAGALYWNPGSISGIQGDDISINASFIFANSTLGSTLYAPNGSVFAGGSTDSKSGGIPVPSMAVVKHIKNSPFTVGFSLTGIAGARTNYAGSGNLLSGSNENPILSSQMLGRLSSDVEVFQMAPTVAYRLSDNLSIGVAPTLTIGRLIASPLLLGPADADGHWAEGAGTRYAVGAGFQAGIYLQTAAAWDFGLSFKSPQWMEKFKYQYTDTNGVPGRASFALDYPMIISLGTAYRGIDRWLFSTDFRYFNWGSTNGFSDGGFTDEHALNGLGWKDMFSMATGVSYQMTETLTLRGGFCYNTNPIPDDMTLYNVASPLNMQFSYHVGGTVDMGDQWLLSAAYTHVFQNRSEYMYEDYANGMDMNIWSTASADAVWMGISKRF